MKEVIGELGIIIKHHHFITAKIIFNHWEQP